MTDHGQYADADRGYVPHPNGVSREPRYWRRRSGIEDRFVGDVQPGPRWTVRVGKEGGIDLHSPGFEFSLEGIGAGEARWVALRLIEAAARYEAMHDPAPVPVDEPGLPVTKADDGQPK